MLTTLEALHRAVKIAEEARQEWDAAPSGMRAGKILIALSGGCPGYRRDIDEIHEVLKFARDRDWAIEQQRKHFDDAESGISK